MIPRDEELDRIAEIAIARELELREYARQNAAKGWVKGRLKIDFKEDLTPNQEKALYTLPFLLHGSELRTIHSTRTGFRTFYLDGDHALLERIRRVLVIQSFDTGTNRVNLKSPEVQAHIWNYVSSEVDASIFTGLFEKLEEVRLSVLNP